jgi:adenine-specific DNA-methyltransferase
MTFRYIGSKARVVEQIGEHLGYARGGFFVDVFCGTGAVAELAAELGWPVRLNDHLSSATKIAAARLLARREVPFKNLGGYEAAIALLNRCTPVRGFVWREYSPASRRRIGLERRYFTEANASRIDGIRAKIRSWRNAGAINEREELLLIGDLLGAVNRVANIAGTYGCFLSTWTPPAMEKLTLKPRQLKPRTTPVEICNVDASAVPTGPEDIAYLDPPYTKRQYASYYHILETICLGDEPSVEGVAGLRPWRVLASDYCYKVRALNALATLIANVSARRVLLSYSNEGHVPMDGLKRALINLGKVEVHELATIGRYRPNVQASVARSSVTEYLIVVEKTKIKHRPRKREFAVA